jgi:hypothetical protein
MAGPMSAFCFSSPEDEDEDEDESWAYILKSQRPSTFTV